MRTLAENIKWCANRKHYYMGKQIPFSRRPTLKLAFFRVYSFQRFPISATEAPGSFGYALARGGEAGAECVLQKSK